MARIAYVREEGHDPLVELFYAGCRELIGRVPNASRLYAHFPKAAVWFLPFLVTLQRDGAGGRLDGATKELAILATSTANQCNYCIQHNSSLGRATGLSARQIEAVQGDYRSSDALSDREKAVTEWAMAVARNSAMGDTQAFEHLRQFFREDEILELTWVCALFNMNNRVHDALWADIEEQSDIDLIQRSKIASERAVLRFVRQALELAEAELAARTGPQTDDGEAAQRGQ